MKRISFTIFIFYISLITLSSKLSGQEISATIVDSLSKKPISFATIYLSNNKGVVSNEDGEFKISYDLTSKKNDSLFISCMGYKKLSYPISKFKDSIIYLPPTSIELNSIILSNNTLTAEQVIEQIRQEIPVKYELGFTKKKLFFRQSGIEQIIKLNVKIKKSSINEFNQTFWDSTLKKIPRKAERHNEILGNLYGDFSIINQKLELKKALELEDKKVTAVFKNIENLFGTILKENVKTDSYFKIRTGILGTKVDANKIFDSKDLDTLSIIKKDSIKKNSFLQSRKRIITNINQLFKDEKLNLFILKKSKKYTFKITKFTYFGETPVYIISFDPKENEDYKGKIYVDADQMTLIRLEYKNIKNIRDFKLLGLSYKETLKEVIIQFKKMKSGKYTIQYLEYVTGSDTMIKRPLVITEKNKIVKGRNRQNQLKMNLDMSQRLYQKYQMVVFKTTPISKLEFETFKEETIILPVNLTQYDPTFWKGYNIIEPNTAIKDFKTKID